MSADAELRVFPGVPVDLDVPGFYPDAPECDDPECACHEEAADRPAERVTMTEVY